MKAPTVKEFAKEGIEYYRGYLNGIQAGLGCKNSDRAFELQAKARRKFLFYSTLLDRATEYNWLSKPYDYEEMMQDLWEDWMVKPYPESEAVVEALNECLEYNKQRLAESKQPLT